MRRTQEILARLKKKCNMSQKFYKLANKVPFIPAANRYHLTICHEKKFLWFRVAKVGTKTIFNFFRENNVFLDVDHGFVYYSPKLFAAYFKFAFVRNPWDRLVSCWLDKVIDHNHFRFSDSELGKMKNFDNFVEYVANLDIEKCDNHLRIQSALINFHDIDYLGRLETFRDDFKYISQKLGMNQEEVKARNVTRNRKPYQEYYSVALKEKVFQIYRKDIQIFGYDF